MYCGSRFTPFLITEKFGNCLSWIIFSCGSAIPVNDESFKECRLAFEVLSLLKSILKVEKHLSTVMLSGETTTMADKNSCTSPVLFLK